MADDSEGRDASDGEPPCAPGDIIAGKYRVERLLGVGGMGKVVAAVHVDLRERRAIKLMLSRHSNDSEAVERFLREARASARLKSEHVVKVHDVGRLPGGAPYMVMEYLKGRDLGAELEKRGPLPVAEAALYVLQACEALAEAHALGIIHRDLKPENLFLAKVAGGARAIKIVDFGISKVASAAGELRMTRTTAIMGSPCYMSPEQTRSTHDVDGRADIWSLGVVLYQLVTGRMPFDGQNLTEVVTAVLFSDVPPPSTLGPGLPRKVDRIILRCLERDLARRYPSVIELANDLSPFAPPDGQGAPQRIGRLTSTSVHFDGNDSVSGGAVSSDRSTAPGGARRTWAVLLSAGAALAADPAQRRVLREPRQISRRRRRGADAGARRREHASCPRPGARGDGVRGGRPLGVGELRTSASDIPPRRHDASVGLERAPSEGASPARGERSAAGSDR